MFLFRRTPKHKIYTSSDCVDNNHLEPIKRTKDFVYIKDDLETNNIDITREDSNQSIANSTINELDDNISVKSYDSDTSIIEVPIKLKIKNTKHVIIINPHNFTVIIDKTININNSIYNFTITNSTKILPIFDHIIIIAKTKLEFLDHIKTNTDKISFIITENDNYMYIPILQLFQISLNNNIINLNYEINDILK